MLRLAIVTMVPIVNAWAAALSSEHIRKEAEKKQKAAQEKAPIASEPSSDSASDVSERVNPE